MPLTAAVAGIYTLKNLIQSTAYTVCFTPDGTTAPVTANVTTIAGQSTQLDNMAGCRQRRLLSWYEFNRLAGLLPDGTPYLAYSDGGNSGKTTVMKYSGTSWGLVGSAGFSAGTAIYESLAFSPDGTPYVAYQDGGNSTKATVMKYSGTSWVLVGSAGFSAGAAYNTSLSFSPDGTPYVAYQDSGNGNYATVMKYNGTSWVLVGSAGFSAGQSQFESLAFSPDGTPYVAYRDLSNGLHETVMKYNGSTWVTVGAANFTAGDALYNSLAFSPAARPTWRTAMEAPARRRSLKYNGTSWMLVGSAGFSADGISFPSLAFSPDGTPYVAYSRAVMHGKATVMQYSGTSWVVAGSAEFSAGGASYPSLAFSPDGTAYVAYEDAASNGKMTVMNLVAVPIVTTGTATSITGTAATLNGTVNDNGVATTGISFDYGTDDDFQDPDNPYPNNIAATTPTGGTLAANSGSTAASLDITGLSPATTYHFRLNATGSGATINGDDATFITPDVPAVGGIAPTSGTTAGGTTVIISGVNFTNAGIVSFGSTAAASYNVDGDAQITAVSPASSAGVVDVIVTTPGRLQLDKLQR